MEILTLVQTRKLAKEDRHPPLRHGILEGDRQLRALVRYGTIAREDLDLFQFADDPDTALAILKEGLTRNYLKPGVQLPANEQEHRPSRSR